MKLQLAGIPLDAESVGGIRTAIALPQSKLCFDLGLCTVPLARCSTVCITHSHVDHLGSIAHHVALRHLWRNPPARYLVPEEAVDDVVALLDVWRRLDRSELPAEIVPVAPGSEVELDSRTRIRVFRAYHRVPTLGYALERTHNRLLPELAGLPGPEIGRRRAAGEVVSEPVPAVDIAFCGDTTASVLDREELPLQARLLVLECTFLDEPGAEERARKSGHVHLRALAERADRLEDHEAVLLTHFSPRYAPRQVVERLREALPERLHAKVTALV